MENENSNQTLDLQEGQNIIEAYLTLVDQQSTKKEDQSKCYGEFSNSQSWKQFSNHNNPFSQSG